MEILDYFNTVNPKWWLGQLTRCDWTAGHFLHDILNDGRFRDLYGERSTVLMLTDGARLVSFCTYSERDCIPDTERTPWLGFVYTHPDYRGRRLMGRLIAEAKARAREDGSEALWIATHDRGIYEKYGAVYDTLMKDAEGGDSLVYRLDTYGFYGWERADVPARITDYRGIRTPRDLYNALWHVWSAETCTARMREEWSTENRTLGQCTITAFLAQDIFGGLVYGIPLEDGNYHSFNVVGDRWFDLTSEQFGTEKLQYDLRREQLRHDHFLKPGKRERYEMLKAGLLRYLSETQQPGRKDSDN